MSDTDSYASELDSPPKESSARAVPTSVRQLKKDDKKKDKKEEASMIENLGILICSILDPLRVKEKPLRFRWCDMNELSDMCSVAQQYKICADDMRQTKHLTPDQQKSVDEIDKWVRVIERHNSAVQTKTRMRFQKIIQGKLSELGEQVEISKKQEIEEALIVEFLPDDLQSGVAYAQNEIYTCIAIVEEQMRLLQQTHEPNENKNAISKEVEQELDQNES